MAPTATPKMRRPIWAVPTSSAALIAGIRAIQLAIPMPHTAKMAKMPFRQATT